MSLSFREQNNGSLVSISFLPYVQFSVKVHLVDEAPLT